MSAQTGKKYSLPIYYVHAIVKHFRLDGGDMGELLDRSRISSELLESDSARVSPEQYSRLQANAMAMMGDEALGYTGQALPVGAWQMMCHAVITAETLGEALQRYCEFFNLIDWGIYSDLWEEEDKLVFRPRETAGPALERYPYASCLTNTFRFFSWLGEQFLPVVAIHFACSRPDHHREYKGIFMGTPVLFDKPDYRMEISRSCLSLPLKQSVMSLRRYLRHPLYEMSVLDYETALWSGKVRKIIESDLARPPVLAALADQLGIHQQALRRRLADEGTSYREIRNQTRLDTALYYLGKPELSIESVSERAGFSEASAFIRAFKNWTGITPDQHRRQVPGSG